MDDPGRGTILVVDDDADDRMFVRRALRTVAGDLHVAEAVDGEQALIYLRDTSRPFPDLVLLDLKMPRMDGFETLAAIRRDPLLLHRPVVAIFTTATDPESVRKAYRAGANAYVAKPSSMGSLTDMMAGVVRHWFDTATLPQHPRAAAAPIVHSPGRRTLPA